MDSILQNRTLRRRVRNTLLAQKRFNEAKEDVTEEMVREYLEYCDDEQIKSMYVNDAIDVETLEAIFDFKYGLSQHNAGTI